LDAGNWQPVLSALTRFREAHRLDDWFYYQLIRKAAQNIAPKAENYHRYTLYKWFFLCKSGYDATLAIENDQLKFYVRSEENVYNIPYYMNGDKQYVCLNIHDYPPAEFRQTRIDLMAIDIPGAEKAFSYKVTQVPDFTDASYASRDLKFQYRSKVYSFNVVVNIEVQSIFKNYPVVDYASYFNIPLSKKTYSSLIPLLRKNVEGLSQKKGVDFLMHFTRNAFLYEVDEKVFGKERRLSPEQTLLTQYSDCDDRAALFFYLVKEVYNLPMVVLLYPTHVTIAVNFDKAGRNTIVYKGRKYSVCEPTPQADNLRIGELSPELRDKPYQIAYAYEPAR
jgi:hypothetical protein